MDFCKFLAGLNIDVAVIKMDIAGAEVELMERMLDDPVAARIAAIFIAIYERKSSHLADGIDH